MTTNAIFNTLSYYCLLGGENMLPNENALDIYIYLAPLLRPYNRNTL